MILEYLHQPEADFEHNIHFTQEEIPNQYYDWVLTISDDKAYLNVEFKKYLKQWLKDKDYKINPGTIIVEFPSDWPKGKHNINQTHIDHITDSIVRPKHGVFLSFKNKDIAIAFKLKFDFG